jgi:hypothetical protein
MIRINPGALYIDKTGYAMLVNVDVGMFNGVEGGIFPRRCLRSDGKLLPQSAMFDDSEYTLYKVIWQP